MFEILLLDLVELCDVDDVVLFVVIEDCVCVEVVVGVCCLLVIVEFISWCIGND